MAAGRATLSPGQAQAVQAALAAENAAAYGYGVAGAHLAGAQQQAAYADYVTHQAAADQLTGVLEAAGVAPRPAAVAYRLPQPVTTAAQAASLAATLEDQVTSAYIALVGQAGSGLRRLAAQQARSAALRAAGWRGATVAFPGLPGGS